MTIDRRAFLKRAGLGSISIASLPAVSTLLATPAFASDEGNGLIFQALSTAGRVGDVVHVIAMSGSGRIEEGQVEAGGFFTHFNSAKAPRATENDIFGAGTWEAKRLRSFSTIGAFGTIVAGIAVIDIRLMSDFPSQQEVAATLRVVCNIGAPGIQTGEPEGFVLSVPGLLTFRPFSPPVGITAFTRRLRRED